MVFFLNNFRVVDKHSIFHIRDVVFPEIVIIEHKKNYWDKERANDLHTNDSYVTIGRCSMDRESLLNQNIIEFSLIRNKKIILSAKIKIFNIYS